MTRSQRNSDRPLKTKEEALRDLMQVVAEEVAIIRQLTVREAAERIWVPGGPSVEELMVRTAATGLCKDDADYRES